jgi:hypothetical protein
MSNAPLTRAARYGQTKRKAIMLTAAGLAELDRYARQEQLPFSAAIEALAKRGLDMQTGQSVKRLLPTYDSNIDLILTLAKTAPTRRNRMDLITGTIEDRYGKTERKHVTLTKDTIETIEKYAKQHRLTFSVAIETLAMMGMNRTAAEALPRLLTGLLDSILNRYLGRYARLSSQAAMAAEEANTKADFMVLQTLWREARQDPDGFEEKLGISLNPNVQPDRRVRELQQQVKDLAQTAAIERLRQDAESAAGGEQEGMTDG